MQRVRIGLTGLAFVFLLVLLGTILGRASDEEPITANAIEMQQIPGAQAKVEDSKPKEPLAELGVAPGTGGADNASQNAAETNDLRTGQR